jgi:hypothetical protein
MFDGFRRYLMVLCSNNVVILLTVSYLSYDNELVA